MYRFTSRLRFAAQPLTAQLRRGEGVRKIVKPEPQKKGVIGMHALVGRCEDQIHIRCAV
jgi:hypothetical protein